MELTLVATGIPDLLPMQRTGDPRHHVSYIINDLSLKLGHYDRSDTRPYNYMSLGNAFEDMIARSLADRYSRNDPDRFVVPGELEWDGLIGSPDLYDIMDSTIHEMKLTKKSARTDPESTKFWYYWVQLQAYMYMMSQITQRWHLDGLLHVGFLLGDYRSVEVDYKVWRATFTKDELANNWRMLVSHAKSL